MCGVVGYSGKPQDGDRERFLDLCRQSCIRGVHAFGIAYHNGDGLTVFKSIDFDEVLNAVPEPLPNKIIFHNRYSTSGDHHNPDNNQPIYVDGNALVFNGTVDMGTKAEMEARHGLTLQTDNDGEIVLHDIVEKRKPFAHIENNLATFAGIFLAKDGTMIAFRNRMRPLWAFSVPSGKFISSTRDIASRARFEKNNGTPIEPLTLLQL